MASGTRTALLSRWRTGGKAPSVLTREFAAALPTNSASESWRTATELARIEKLDPKIEPRLKTTKNITEVSADHPFFWAGYLLIDTGAEPTEEEKKENDDAKDGGDDIGDDAANDGAEDAVAEQLDAKADVAEEEAAVGAEGNQPIEEATDPLEKPALPEANDEVTPNP